MKRKKLFELRERIKNTHEKNCVIIHKKSILIETRATWMFSLRFDWLTVPRLLSMSECRPLRFFLLRFELVWFIHSRCVRLPKTRLRWAIKQPCRYLTLQMPMKYIGTLLCICSIHWQRLSALPERFCFACLISFQMESAQHRAADVTQEHVVGACARRKLSWFLFLLLCTRFSP